MQKKILITTLLTILVYFISIQISAFAANYYAATDGSGSTCSIESPCMLDTGIGKLNAGDTLYLRGGTYRQAITISVSGTSNLNRITIRGYPDETSIIDGDDRIPGGTESSWYSPLVKIAGNWVTVRDLEVKNSWGMGVYVGGTYGEVINVYAHGNWENGILLSGDYGLAENCRVYYNCKSNEFGKRGRDGYWASGLTAARQPAYCIIRNCRVWENWGEGISTYEASYTTIEDNITYDNYSVNLYLSDTHHTTCHRNIVYDSANGATQGYGSHNGIIVADEKGRPAISSNNKIINNFVMGCNKNFYAWYGAVDGSGLIDTIIAYNTFVNSTESDTGFGNFDIGPGGSHSNSIVSNNIILQEDSRPISAVYASDGINFSNNLWSKTPVPNAVGTGDIVGDPKLTKTGPTGPGSLTGDYFKISQDSPAIDSGRVLIVVNEDFFRTSRGQKPDMGGYEYTESADNAPPMPPTGLRIVN